MRKPLAFALAMSLVLPAWPMAQANAAPLTAVAQAMPAGDNAVQPVQYRRGGRYYGPRGYRYGPPPRHGGRYYGPPRGHRPPPPPPPGWARGRGDWRWHDGRYWWPRNNGWYVYNDGAWVAAAALGLAAGAMLGAAAASPPASVQAGAPPTRNGIPPWTPAWYQHCSNKYKSFNPQTGLYLGYDGKYHYCQ